MWQWKFEIWKFLGKFENFELSCALDIRVKRIKTWILEVYLYYTANKTRVMPVMLDGLWYLIEKMAN